MSTILKRLERQCPCCGTYRGLQVEPRQDSFIQNENEYTTYTLCTVCKDDTLVVSEVHPDGHLTGWVSTFFQTYMEQALRMCHQVVYTAGTGDQSPCQYYIDDKEVDVEVWRDFLTARRSLLRQLCSN